MLEQGAETFWPLFVALVWRCLLPAWSGQELCRCLWCKVCPTLRYFSKIVTKVSTSCLPQNTKNRFFKCQKKKKLQTSNKHWIYQSQCTVRSKCLFSETLRTESKGVIVYCITVTQLDILHLWVVTRIWLLDASGDFLSPFIFLLSLLFHSWFNFYTVLHFSLYVHLQDFPLLS